MPAPTLPPRSRLRSATAVLLTIALGLASRRFAALLPSFLGKYPGDALWALMVYFGWGFFLPRLAGPRLGLLALATSFAVESSQLYHAPWLDTLRGTYLGHLVLGSGFAWADFLAYTVGVTLGVVGERLIRSGPPSNN